MRFAGPLLLAALAACNPAGPRPDGPGEPEDVASVRVFEGSNDRTLHVFLYTSQAARLEVRMYAADGHRVTQVPGGVTATLAFTPISLATATALAADPLTHDVAATAPAGASGSLLVTLSFPGAAPKTFGPFYCLVH
jgi:hypothetical protein